MRPNRSKTDYIVWHCSATPPSQDIGSAQIDIMHKARGWDGIGYALVIKRDGHIETGEDLKKQGAHVKGINMVSVGVVMIGGVDEDGKSENNFTDEQWKAARHVFEFLTLLYPAATHAGHRDFSPDSNSDGRVQRQEFMKDCPCFSVKQWVENDLHPVEDMYAPWELDVSIEVPDEEITFEDVLSVEDFVEEVFSDEPKPDAPKPTKKKRSKKKK